MYQEFAICQEMGALSVLEKLFSPNVYLKYKAQCKKWEAI